jgi:hypothetical protein
VLMHPLSVSGFAGCLVLAVAGGCWLAATPVAATMIDSARTTCGALMLAS